VAQEGWLVTFGVRPTRPETGFGYIEVGERGQVERFVEKPNLGKATEYVASGRFFWNSGMFCMTPSTFWTELKQHAPNLGRFAQMSGAQVLEEYAQMESTSIDYALMERSRQIAMVPLECTWSDVGSWDHLYDLLEKDDQANAIVGRVHTVGSRNSLVYSQQKRSIALIDCDDLIIVDGEDALLVAKRGSSQKVRSVAQELI
jgi:mannose-1-phosphate guanylyltransferase/mannose-6-phosphate isomerase